MGLPSRAALTFSPPRWPTRRIRPLFATSALFLLRAPRSIIGSSIAIAGVFAYSIAKTMFKPKPKTA